MEIEHEKLEVVETEKNETTQIQDDSNLIKNLLASQKRENKKLKRELENLQNEIKQVETKKTIEQIYLAHGGKKSTFEDYMLKHSNELFEIEEELLENAISISTELSPWSFENVNTEAVKVLEKTETQIYTKEPILHEGTLYEKKEI